MTDTPVAELLDVTKRFGDVTALDSLDFVVRPGELVSLLGPNGAGKTTAIRLLLGLSNPDRGEVRVFGGDPRVRSNRVRTGAMLQVGQVPATLRVEEHLKLFSSYYPSPLPLERLLDECGLSELRSRRFGDLSGGQKQRVLFALGLCGDPDLIFLDEPTVGLDVEARRTLWTMIRRLVDEGRSVLLTTHYLEEADVLADRVVVIDRGTFVADGTPKEIKRSVATRTVRCHTTVEAGAVEGVEGVKAVHVTDGGLELLVTEAEPVVRRLLELDPELHDLEVLGADLETAFLELTGGEVS